jgi:hypothetical protein
MSTLKVNAITDTSGGSNVNVPNAAKAWVNFNGPGTVAIREDYNVSSITDNGTGDYTVNFTNAMANASYALSGSAGSGSSGGAFLGYCGTPTTTNARIRTSPNLSSLSDYAYVGVCVHR